MTRGKKVCKILKEIRQQIADKNDIEYVTSECHFQGECQGTCPKCEAEVRYLENELNRRKQLGKAVAIAGISLGLAGIFSSCNTLQQSKITLNVLEGDVIKAENFFFDTVPDIIQDDSEIIVGELPISDDYNYFAIRFAEEMPEFPRGMEEMYKFLSDNLVYPKEAKENGIQGTVIVEFVIDTSGKVSNAKVIVPLYPECDKEALRVIQEMPNWKPAKHQGKPVAIYYNLPIRFMLKDE